MNQLVSSVTVYVTCDNKTPTKRIRFERDVVSKHTPLLPQSRKVQEGLNKIFSVIRQRHV
jgi:hypothetical protein